MVQITLGLLLGTAFIFLCMYTFDDGIVWEPPRDIRLRQPSLSDIDRSDPHLADEYIKHEICPAYHYFILRNELEEPFRGSGSEIFSGIYLIAPCALLAASGLRSSGLIKSRALCIAISVAALFLLGFLVRLLYRRYLEIPRYEYSPEDFSRDREHLAQFPFEYGETLDAALNNYAIRKHHSYLSSLRKTVRTRIALRRILIFLGMISYVLLFLPYIEL